MSKSHRKNLRVLLVGPNGRMGREIQSLAKRANSGSKVIVGVSRSGLHLSEVDARMIDVVIDFSSPEGFREALAWAERHKKAFVSGTTGLKPGDFAKLRKAARKVPVLWAANMSYGIAFLRQVLRSFSALSGWEIHVEEAHHAKKKDKPSGTAIVIQEDLEKSLSRRLPPIKSIRKGKIPGIHTITAQGPEEQVTLQHIALKRTVFARGALLAARRLFDKKRPGLYELSDLTSAVISK